MAEYKRFLSYLYAYDGENKAGSAGFAKVDVRSGKCRISVNVRYTFDGAGRGYRLAAYTKSGIEKEIIELGTLQFRNRTGEIAVMTAEDSIGRSGRRLNELGGLVIFREPGSRIYITSWEDGQVGVNELRLAVYRHKEEGVDAKAVREGNTYGRQIEMTPEQSRDDSIKSYIPEASWKHDLLSAAQVSGESSEIDTSGTELEINADSWMPEDSQSKRIENVSEVASEVWNKPFVSEREQLKADRENEQKQSSYQPEKMEAVIPENKENKQEQGSYQKEEMKEHLSEWLENYDPTQRRNDIRSDIRPWQKENGIPPVQEEKNDSSDMDLQKDPGGMTPVQEETQDYSSSDEYNFSRERMNTEHFSAAGQRKEDLLYDSGKSPADWDWRNGISKSNPERDGSENNGADMAEIVGWGDVSGKRRFSGNTDREHERNNQVKYLTPGNSSGKTGMSEEENEREDSLMRQESEKDTPEESVTWTKLRKLFPKVRLLDDSEWEVLKISLQDIGRLPRENWIYGNNSFLLHGYYHYRYLILAKKKQSLDQVCILGIPGVFSINEKFMAAMFGITDFMEAKEQGKGKNFGFWCIRLRL